MVDQKSSTGHEAKVVNANVPSISSVPSTKLSTNIEQHSRLSRWWRNFAIDMVRRFLAERRYYAGLDINPTGLDKFGGLFDENPASVGVLNFMRVFKLAFNLNVTGEEVNTTNGSSIRHKICFRSALPDWLVDRAKQSDVDTKNKKSGVLILGRHDFSIEPFLLIGELLEAGYTLNDIKVIGVDIFGVDGIEEMLLEVVPKRYASDAPWGHRAGLFGKFLDAGRPKRTTQEITRMNSEALKDAAQALSQGKIVIIFPAGPYDIHNHKWLTGVGKIITQSMQGVATVEDNNLVPQILMFDLDKHMTRTALFANVIRTRMSYERYERNLVKRGYRRLTKLLAPKSPFDFKFIWSESVSASEIIPDGDEYSAESITKILQDKYLDVFRST